MNQNFAIMLPCIEGWWRTFGDESVGFDTPTSGIISGNDDLAREKVVTKPHFVLRKEPVRVVRNV